MFLQLTFEKFSYRQKSRFTKATLIVFFTKMFCKHYSIGKFLFLTNINFIVRKEKITKHLLNTINSCKPLVFGDLAAHSQSYAPSKFPKISVCAPLRI